MLSKIEVYLWQLEVAENFLFMKKFSYNSYLKFNVIINHHCRYIDNGDSYCDMFNEEIVNNSVYSPLHLACLHGHKEVFELLFATSEFNQQM